MRVVPMNSKIRTADGKLRPLFAIVDTHGHTVIQVTSLDRAKDVLRFLA
jgi:hypothetical protein